MSLPHCENCFDVRYTAKIMYYDKDTANTPYKAGLSTSEAGICLLMHSTNYMLAFCISLGNQELFNYCKNDKIEKWFSYKFS